MIKACIFDFDGTLMNTLEDIAASINYGLINHGFEPKEVEDYRFIVGGDLYDMARLALPEESRDEETILGVCKDYQEDYSKHFFRKSKPYPGVVEMLEKLVEKGIDICVISNKPIEYMVPMANAGFPSIHFKHIIGSTSGFPPKPDPTSCNVLMSTLGIREDEAIFIGDSDVDIQIAKNAGAFSIGCGWGFRGGEELIKEGSDYVIHNALDVLEVINILNKKRLQGIMDEANMILKSLEVE